MKFKDFFSKRFGVLFTDPDDPGVCAARDVWNQSLETAAKEFEFNDDISYTGDQVADLLRRAKERPYA
jgi:hypothetical protein